MEQLIELLRPESSDEEKFVEAASKELSSQFWEVDQRTKRTMSKLLTIFEKNCIDPSAFHGVNGYGHGDIGREKLDLVIAELLGAEAAAVRLQFFSGTHAIASGEYHII